MKLNRLDAELCPFHFPSWVGPPQLCVCGPSGHSRSLSKELEKKKDTNTLKFTRRQSPI